MSNSIGVTATRSRWVVSAFLCTLALGLTGCSEKEAAAPPPKLFKQQRDTLDQAKALEKTLQEQAEQTRKRLEDNDTGKEK